MSLRSRLIATFTVLLGVAIVVTGLIAMGAVRATLTQQIDDLLVEAARRGAPADLRRPEEGPFRRSVAVLVVGPGGRILRSSPSGFDDAPDPLPDPSRIPADFRGFTTVASGDESVTYRALVVRGDAGLTTVWAAPLGQVDRAVAAVGIALLAAGAAVLLAGAGATWWSVRRGLRPIDRVVEAASSIAAGDLSRRVDVQGTNTEIARLGSAFNEMVADIEAAMAAEEEGRLRLRRFVADASHELRTPLAAISGYTEAYRKGMLAEAADVDRAMERIERESTRMHRLVEDLIVLARLGEDRGLRRSRVDVAALVHEAAADHRAMDPSRPVSVVATDGVHIAGDRDRLLQVFGGLLSNVRAHTPEGTTVLIDVRAESESVVVEIADDGPGVPEAAVERIFDRFFRVDPSRSRERGGAGLGLAIVAGIVEAHGGSVRAQRSTQGGLLVTVSLPSDGEGAAAST